MHLITGRNVQEHQILLAVINLPYIVRGENGGEEGDKGHKETNMVAGAGCVVRSEVTRVSKNSGGEGKAAMKDDEGRRFKLRIGLKIIAAYKDKTPQKNPENLFPSTDTDRVSCET